MTIYKSIIIFFFTFCLCLSVQTLYSQCLQVDLQAVSIDPTKPTIAVGENVDIVVVMKNNNACAIPTGEATAQVTINSLNFDIGSPIGFSDPCGLWTYLGVKTTGEQHNLFFQNKGGIIPPGTACNFQFTIKGKQGTTKATVISLSSSLSVTATTADMDGNNQSANTEIRFTGTKTTTQFPVNLTEFNAKADGCNVTLKWKTGGKPESNRFDIEYSTDGTNFIKIETLPARSPAAGTSYEYTTDKGSGSAYYRINIITRDEQSNYSKVVNVVTNCPPKKAF